MWDIFKKLVKPKEQPDKERGPCCTWEKSCHCNGDSEEEEAAK
jgi:hypothetical protein